MEGSGRVRKGERSMGEADGSPGHDAGMEPCVLNSRHRERRNTHSLAMLLPKIKKTEISAAILSRVLLGVDAAASARFKRTFSKNSPARPYRHPPTAADKESRRGGAIAMGDELEVYA